MSNNVDKTKFIGSAFWKMMESLSTKGVALIVSVVLARLLLPEAYGIVTLTNVYIFLGSFLVQGGFTTALVCKDEVTDEDYSNAFIFCIMVAAVCYGIFYMVAPALAMYYDEPMFTKVLRVQMLSLFLCAFGTVNSAMITRQFRFQTLCIANLIANVVSGVAGVVIAYAGYGVWALVFQVLIRDGITAIILPILVKWKFTLRFSFRKIKDLLSFSSWALLGSLMDYFGNNFAYTVFGGQFPKADIGYYGKGNQLPELIALHTFGAISGVMLPTMRENKEDRQRLLDITRKIAANSAYIIFPMMAGLSLVGTDLVAFLFTEKWLPCVPVLYATSLSFGINIFRQINMQLIYALGHAKIAARIEVIRFGILISAVTVGVLVFDINIFQLAYIYAGINITVVVLTQWFARKYIGYSYRLLLRDILPTVLLVLGMAATTLLAGTVKLPLVISLFFQVLVGAGTYVALSWIFKTKCFMDIKSLALDFVKRKLKRK